MQSIRSLITAHPIITGSSLALNTLLVIACVLSGASFVHAQEETFYFLTDHLGSVDVVLDEDANVVERREYLPYGTSRVPQIPRPSHVSDTVEPRSFTGKELDTQTGLHYYGARYYDSDIGRFTGIDPWEGGMTDPQTLNKYSYTINNPLKYIDPTGEKVEWVGRRLTFSSLAMHSYLEITPDRPQDFGVDHEFKFTIGGQMNANNGALVGEINNEGDLNFLGQYEEFSRATVSPVDSSISDTQFIANILNVHASNTNELYDISSTIGYNCNNYSASLIEGAEGTMSIDPYSFAGLFPLTNGLEESIPALVNATVPMSPAGFPADFEEKVLEPARNNDRILTEYKKKD